MHPTFKQAYNLAYAFCSVGPDGWLGFLTAPSGAGKSTVLDELEKHVFGEARTWPEDIRPLIRVSANKAQQGRFSQKKLIFDLFSQVEDPFRGSHALTRSTGHFVGRESKLEDYAEWRWTGYLSQLLVAYGVKDILIDEANLMCLAPGRQDPTDYLDALRVLAHEAKVRILLAGTYALLEVWNHNAQVNRRCVTLPIARYLRETEEQQKDFLRVLLAIERDLKLKRGLLTSNADSYYESSYGIPGEVYSHVKRALVFQAADKCSVLQPKHLVAARHLPRQLARLREEVDAGELVLFDTDVPKDSGPATPAAKKGHRPGQRSPTRHPVGKKS